MDVVANFGLDGAACCSVSIKTFYIKFWARVANRIFGNSFPGKGLPRLGGGLKWVIFWRGGSFLKIMVGQTGGVARINPMVDFRLMGVGFFDLSNLKNPLAFFFYEAFHFKIFLFF